MAAEKTTKDTMQEYNEQMTEVENLYREVVKYDRAGDVYNAVKLCKRVARLAPDWSAPFAYLGWIYKCRQEWKPTYHYSLRAVENNPFDDNTWEHLALAATVLKEWETARLAWNQLGFEFKESDEALRLNLGSIAACLNPGTHPEIVEASRIDPARAVIESIPQPSSGHRYQDLVLLDVKPNRYHHVKGRKIPVYDELQLLKQSPWRTFAVLLHTSSRKNVNTLAQLCNEAGLGFDNWSNAARFFTPGLHPRVSEYFDHTIFGKLERDTFLVAIASLSKPAVEEVLQSWEVISLDAYSGLECLF
ncbi:MAG: tetratricopeptide repeat protein [Saprospiraceae bacterium]